ncbi:MAG: hypothetical protein ABIW81_08115 [Terrimesophilobacter sp.]
MKRIAYAGGTIETGDAVADALLDYVTTVSQSEINVSVDIPVREANGGVTTHTLVLGPATQLDVSDVEVAGSTNEEVDFPVPELWKSTEEAQSEPPDEAAQAARDFDEAVAEIDHNLDGMGEA